MYTINIRLKKNKYLLYLLIFAGIFLFVLNVNPSTIEQNVDISLYEPNDRLYKQVLAAPVTRLNLTSPLISVSTGLIALVISQPGEEEERRDIRATWANGKQSNAIKNGSVSVIFLLGTRGTDGYLSIGNEIEIHRDILVVDVEDTYRNLVYKELAAFRWLSVFYPEAVVAKIDSDVVLRLDALYSVVRSHSQDREWMHCRRHKFAKPERNPLAKWYVPYRIFESNYFPEYCNGPIYVISPFALRRVLQSALLTQVFELEDVFFTGVLGTLTGIPIFNEENIFIGKPWSQICSNGKPTVIGYPLHAERKETGMLRAFEDFKNLRCKLSIELLFHYARGLF